MRIATKAQVLTVYIGEDDKWHSGLLYSAIVEKLLDAEIAGTTVFRGIEGYGAHQRLHTSRMESMFTSLPIVIQVVDLPDRIALAKAIVDEMVVEGLVTVYDVDAVRYSIDPQG